MRPSPRRTRARRAWQASKVASIVTGIAISDQLSAISQKIWSSLKSIIEEILVLNLKAVAVDKKLIAES
jgi:hypothetical protein